jgi:hypothetical protein
MRDELDFAPRYAAEEALLEFAEQQRLRQHLPQSAVLARSEERLRAIIKQRERGREWREAQAEAASDGGARSETGAPSDISETGASSNVEQGGEDE